MNNTGRYDQYDYELNPASPRVVKELLRKYGFQPKKRLGQNFLVDGNILNKIVTAAEISPDDFVLEVGAGIGVLTRALAEKAKMVTTVETDRALAPLLQEILGTRKNIRLVFADILKVNLQALIPAHMTPKVVANIPYYITSPLLFRLLEAGIKWNLLVFLVQKEVGERITAVPGSSAYGALTVGIQHYARVEMVGTVSPNVFFPRPKVSSVILRLLPRERESSKETERVFKLLVRTAFTFRRKKLSNALQGILSELGGEERVQEAFRAMNLDPGERGENLSPEQFWTLASHLTKRGEERCTL